jgi:uncharacterized protein
LSVRAALARYHDGVQRVPPPLVPHPLMRQSWRDLTFLHWPYDPSVVRPLVPAELELDLYDGAAWVGLVPFLITGLTHPRAPVLPWLSNFAETNVRTYVVDRQGRAGVWFFSLDAARLPAVIGARLAYALPYFWARMTIRSDQAGTHYTSTRLHGPKAESDILVQPGDAIATPTERERFLTARFRLYARRGGRLLDAAIEHEPWPLQRANVLELRQNLVRASGLPEPSGEPLAQFARKVDVLVAAPGASPRIAVG